MTIQPARHEHHACCLLRAGFLAFQPVVDNTRGTPVGEVVSSFQKIVGLAHNWRAFDSAKNHKRQRRKRQSVTAKREKSQTPKFV